MNLKILSLDLGTTTGWSTFNKTIRSGSVSFQPTRFESSGRRYFKFKQWLTEIKNKTSGFDVVYFEAVAGAHLGQIAAHTYGGFLAILQAWCEHHQIAYEGVAVGTIKRFITGKGNAGKQQVIDAVRAKGHCPKDDNEADSLALLYLALEQEKIPYLTKL